MTYLMALIRVHLNSSHPAHNGCLPLPSLSDFAVSDNAPRLEDELAFHLNIVPSELPVNTERNLIGKLIPVTDEGLTRLGFAAGDDMQGCAIARDDWSHVQLEIPSTFQNQHAAMTECVQVLFRMSFETFAAFRSRVSLHASCVVMGDSAICFTAPSGVGKSTRAKRITELVEGSYILNGDRPALLYDETEGVRVFGMPWSGKEDYFINESSPLKAIVQLRRHVRPRIRKLHEADAKNVLMKRVSKPFWCEEAFAKVLETTAHIAKSVPVYRLDCVLGVETDELLLAVLNGNTDLLLSEGEQDMQIKKGFMLRKILDDWMVIPTGAQSAVQQGAIILDDVSAFIWDKLTTPITRGELIQSILEEYNVDERTAAKDLDELIDELKKMDVLEAS